VLEWGLYPGCARGDVDPAFAADCDHVIGPLPFDFVVYAGKRSTAKQDELYAQGRTTPGPIVTNARGGQSPHEFGLAIDAVLRIHGALTQSQNGVLTWDYSLPGYVALVAAVNASSNLHSGHTFPVRDDDHVERTKWRLHIGN
jgi:peptidoglycan L-alanyl-D-glutamate endopeptidase CwlK